MARRTSDTAAVAALGERARAVRERLVDAPDVDVAVVASTVALAGILPLAGTRLVLNAPVAAPVLASGSWQALAGGAALAGPALAAILLGLRADDPAVQVGLVATGTFGLLAVPVPAAAVPGVGAVVAGAWLVGGVHLVGRRRAGDAAWPATAVAGALLAGLTLALAGGAGLARGTLRPAGSVLALAGVVGTPALVGAPGRELAGGGVVALLVLVAGATAPFVTGAVVLVVWGAVGVPLALVALAAGGATATVLAGLGSDGTVAAAGGLLLAAGVPATLPRALAVTVSVALLLEAVADPGGEPA